MMKFVYKIFVLLTVTYLGFSLSSYQNGAATNGRSATGAPFGNGTCGSCHAGGRYGTVTVAIQIFEIGSTIPITNYVGGKAYDAKLTITAATAPPYYGFQMVAVNASNAQAGTWSGFPTGVKGTTLASRVYVEQSTRLTANSFKMTWVAPSAGTGKVTFYASGNCVNGTGNASGDNTGTTSLALSEQTTTCPSATITASGATTFCQGGSVNLTASGGTSYSWSNGATTATLSNVTVAGPSVWGSIW